MCRVGCHASKQHLSVGIDAHVQEPLLTERCLNLVKMQVLDICTVLRVKIEVPCLRGCTMEWTLQKNDFKRGKCEICNSFCIKVTGLHQGGSPGVGMLRWMQFNSHPACNYGSGSKVCVLFLYWKVGMCNFIRGK